MGAPQPSDIISASARDSSQSFGDVNREVLHFFKDTAKDLITKYSAEEALCRALAIISGYTKTLKQKSLLTSLEGMVTLKLTGRIKGLSGGTYSVFRLLKELMNPDLVTSIKSMRIMMDEDGVVFDIHEKDKEEFMKNSENLKEAENLMLEVCETLPELKEVGGYGGNSYGRNGYGRGGYGRNGYGGRGGYRGRQNSGGYGSRGFGNSSSNFGGGGSRRFYNSKSSIGGGSWSGDRREGSGFSNRNSNGFSSGNKDKQKLFVGNLPFDIRESKFEEWIKSRNVDYKDSYLVKDAEGNCRGFGYIKFDSPSATQDALKNLNNCYINDRRIKIDYATEKNN